MKNCIYGLVRGYPNLTQYKKLIERNLSISKFINLNNHDMVIFHEGNISKDHQDYIKLESKNSDLIFIDISDEFNLPQESLDAHDELQKKPKPNYGIYLGAKIMFRFYSIKCFEYLRQYDYIMRADEDIVFENKVDYDIFSYMHDHSLILGYGKRKIDSHPLGITLPPVIKKYVNDYNIKISCDLSEINTQQFYSNLSILKTDFWLKKETKNYLKFIDDTQGIFNFRWGDHIIQANGIKMFSHPKSWFRFKNLEYRHDSHGWSTSKNLRQEWEIDTSKYK